MNADRLPRRRPAIWVILVSSLALIVCVLTSSTLVALGQHLADPDNLRTTLSVCMAAKLRPEPRLAVSWRAPQFATVRPIDWVRAYPNIVCARVPGVGMLRTRGLWVLPPRK